MIEVNVSELSNYIKNLNSLINEYEEVQLNLFNQLKNSSINWKDGNSIKFDEDIYLDKKEANLILIYLKDIKDIMDYIYLEYNQIGKKIHINLNKKNNILYSVENCYNQCRRIISRFDNIDRSFYYREQEQISRQRYRFVEIYNKLIRCRNDLSKLYKKIEKIENEIRSMINRIKDVRINYFNFIFVNNRFFSDAASLDKILLEKDIEQIKFYSLEEKKYLHDICLRYNECCEKYKCNNGKLLSRDVTQFSTNIDKIASKRNEYVIVLNKVIERYDELVRYVNYSFSEKK